MAVQQPRTLNIPVYSNSADPELAGEVIEGEPVEDVLGLQPKRTVREQIATHGLRDTFITQPRDARRGSADPRVQVREQGRAKREAEASAAQQAEAAYEAAQEAQNQLAEDALVDSLARLKFGIAQEGEKYMQSLRRSGILGVDQTPAEQRKKLTGMHQVYASMMVLQCVKPLQEGITAKGLVSVLGMGASMWTLSPNFRTQVGSFTGQLGDAIRGKIEERSARKDDKAQNTFDKLARRGHEDRLSNKWRKRLDRVEHAERGYREPFTTESAAMTEVALAESAYADMRHPGVDVQVVQDRYDTALSALYEYIDADGLDRSEVSRAMRVIVGQRIDHDPFVASTFSELSHGQFAKTEAREVYIEGTTDKVRVWTGDYQSAAGDQVISRGSFSARPPGDAKAHRIMTARTMVDEMSAATSAAELNDMLSQYAVSSSMANHPGLVETIEDPTMRARAGRVRAAFASMAADGIEPDERRFVYTAAYMDALGAVQQLNPEISSQWAVQYGDEWRATVADEMRRYADMGRDADAKVSSPMVFPTARFTADAGGTVQDMSFSTTFTESVQVGEDIVDAEIVEDEPVSEPSRGDHGRSVSADEQAIREQGPAMSKSLNKTRVSTAERIRRVTINQEYNDAETGGILGLGSDEAEPLQDPDFELG